MIEWKVWTSSCNIALVSILKECVSDEIHEFMEINSLTMGDDILKKGGFQNKLWERAVSFLE